MPRRSLVFDAVVGALVLVATLALVRHGEGARGLDALGALLAVLTSAPLAARRLRPLPVFGLVTAATAALYALGYLAGPPIGVAIALYTVAATREETPAGKWPTRVIVASLFVLFAAVAQHEFPPDPDLLFGALIWAGAWIAGDRTRLRRARIAELEERARRAEREAERDRRLAAAEERMRIARELHDSAGHAINVILVQAGAARLLQERDPERARAALETVEEVARDTVSEIDRLVRALRDDEDVALEPLPRLAALEGLAERHRSSGLPVETRVEGARPLAPGLDRAAYRIVQEALTNVARHGDGPAEVELRYAPDALDITVTNPSSRPDGPARETGHGIAGMRERATLLGGTLEAGRADGVFRLHARLPYGSGSE